MAPVPLGEPGVRRSEGMLCGCEVTVFAPYNLVSLEPELLVVKDCIV